ETTNRRPSGSQSKQNGIVVAGTRAITSARPSPSTARTSPAPQFESQRRPSCQRGDSPTASPVNRVQGLTTSNSLRRDLHPLDKRAWLESTRLRRARPQRPYVQFSGPGVVVDDSAEQIDELAALVGRQRR